MVTCHALGPAGAGRVSRHLAQPRNCLLRRLATLANLKIARN